MVPTISVLSTTRTRANAGACPQLVEADIRAKTVTSGYDPELT